MKVQIRSCLEGARDAEGTTIIIDVFRASNSIIACLERGADFVMPVKTLKEAYLTKEKNPDYLLFGERFGFPPRGFDSGNSPEQISQMHLRNKRIILSTSAGSKGILAAKKAAKIIIASFANARAVTEYIQKLKVSQVTLVPIGLDAKEKALEDELCAEYLKSKLQGLAVDFEQIRRQIWSSPGAKHLRSLGQTDDLEISLQLDLWTALPEYERVSQKITNHTK